MTWATWPIAAVAAGIAVPALLILYFLKLRRRDLEVSTTLLWKKSIQDLQANAPFQKLRRNILLFLQLLCLAAALLALGQPELKATSTVGHRHVILIDRSASMNATDGDPASPGAMTRLDAAKKQAIAFVDALPDPGLFADAENGDQAMVIAFDVTADRRQSFTSSKAELKQAIQSITATDAPSLIQDAIKVAKAYSPRIIDREKLRAVTSTPLSLHLFSDGRLPDSSRLSTSPQDLEAADLSPDDQVTYHAVGSPSAPNVGITGLRAERAYDNPGKLTLFVGIQNACPEPRTVDVELSIDKQVVSVRSVTLAAAVAKPVSPADAPAPAEGGGAGGKPAASPDLDPRAGGIVFSVERPEGGVAVAKLLKNQPDALPTDDVAYVVIPPAKRLAVAFVTTGNLFLQEALEGMDLSRRYKLSPTVYQQMLEGKKVDNIGIGDFDVVVLDRFLPSVPGPDGKPAPGLPPGRALVMGAVPPPPLGAVDDGPAEASLIVDWNREHPALKYAGLSDLLIGKSRKVHVAPETPVQVLARDQAGPAILEAANDATRAIIVPFDPADSDWPLKPGYVLFLATALTYLSSDAAETGGGVGDAIRPGQTLVQRLPLGARDVQLALPDNSRVSLEPAPDGRIAFGPVRSIGFHTISWDGPALPSDPVVDGRPRRAVASNLLDPDESNCATRPVLDLPGRAVSAAGSGDSPATIRKLWPWLLLGCLGLVLLEWFVYNRKVHV